LRGIINKLDYIASLHVGAIWLTPIYKSPMVDNGYDVADYMSINPLYGNMSDMDELIHEAGKKNIKIVMDLVLNHTSDQHEWFKQSAEGKNNPYSDYYIWRDALTNGEPPTNWRGIFGGSAWTWHEKRQQYYLHSFAKEQPDLNWANPKVKQEIFDIVQFWIAKGVGGFRLDAIPYVKKPKVFVSGKVDDIDGLSSVHDATVATEGILDYLKEFKNSFIEHSDVFTVGETNGVDPAQLLDWVGNNGVVDMVFQFNHMNVEFYGAEIYSNAHAWEIKSLKQALNDSQHAVSTEGWYPIYFENHDKPRAIDHFFSEGSDKKLCAKLMAIILFTLRGTPFLYQGEEIGMSNLKWQLSECNDLNAFSQYEIARNKGFTAMEALEVLNKFSRDNARTPMQWSNNKFAGFSEVTPWLKVNPNYTDYNVEDEDKNPDSILNFYRKLAEFHNNNEIVIAGNYEPILEEHDSIFAYKRNLDGKSILVLANFANKEAVYESSLLDGYKLIFTNLGDSKLDGVLRPLEAQVFVQE